MEGERPMVGWTGRQIGWAGRVVGGVTGEKPRAAEPKLVKHAQGK
jgi:hypothetical protein